MMDGKRGERHAGNKKKGCLCPQTRRRRRLVSLFTQSSICLVKRSYYKIDGKGSHDVEDRDMLHLLQTVESLILLDIEYEK